MIKEKTTYYSTVTGKEYESSLKLSLLIVLLRKPRTVLMISFSSSELQKMLMIRRSVMLKMNATRSFQRR